MIKYKQIKPADFPQALTLIKKFYEEKPAYADTMHGKDMLFEEDSFVVGAWDDSKLIGIVGAFPDGYILCSAFLYIEPRWRSKSFGHKLVDEVCKLGAESGCTRAIICTSPDLVDFYKINKFKNTYAILEKEL